MRNTEKIQDKIDREFNTRWFVEDFLAAYAAANDVEDPDELTEAQIDDFFAQMSKVGLNGLRNVITGDINERLESLFKKSGTDSDDRQEEEKVEITVYADCTGFFTQEECNSENLTQISIPKSVLYIWLLKKGWNYEQFIDSYTAEDTMDLVYWLMDSGFGFEIPGKEKYRYGMLHRPFSIGCQPKEGFVYRQKSENQRYHDIIWYNRPLTEKELADYELEVIPA